ncbi:MAG: glycoside hydrolase family 43 protein [Ruminococcus sp.]|nr:glycoside hydrolase family 43 protein [Ruminococcus sp.]
MKYQNPVIKGFYPDPSVCFYNGKYYLVTSTFQYFPGVALFESDDLVNWEQIGYVLTRENQVMLKNINSSGGVFAPTIRVNNGRFYMVTTNDTTHENFYVYTDDIYGEWSDPITVDQGGIDPSLYFEDGKTFFMSNGADDDGVGGVVQCEIDIKTGRKLSKSKCIWQGSGGRYLESPHLYKIGDYYYLMAAEGGTEYGHMITLSRSKSVWGPFENCPRNPILTNRNKAPYLIQGIGHGDLVFDKNGDLFILSLGFRQIHKWMPYHNLGREVFLTPARLTADGWITAGNDGTTDEFYEIDGSFTQKPLKEYTFESTDFGIDWCFLRTPDPADYTLTKESVTLKGTDITLDMADSPTFIALRQRDHFFTLSCNVSIDSGEGGISVYMCESEHYEIAIRKRSDGSCEAVLRLNIGGIKHIQNSIPINGSSAALTIEGDNFNYTFKANGTPLGTGQTKYISSEVSGGFTGAMIGLYAVKGDAEFKGFSLKYNENAVYN